MKKQILVCCNRSLNAGGIEKVLTTFLKKFDFDMYTITLVLHDTLGLFTQQLPLDKLKVICTKDIYTENLLKKDFIELNIPGLCNGIWNRILLRTKHGWYENIMYTHKIFRRKLQFNDHYDAAISFTTDYSDLTMVLDANTERRYAFVHADASRNPQIARYNDSLLQKFDKIFCVSEQTKEQFLFVHPKCKKNTGVFSNILLNTEIRELSNEPHTGMMHHDSYILCTVGRLSSEKGQQMIPSIVRLLLDSGYDVYWYLVGDGSLRKEIETKSRQLGVSDRIVLLGTKSNPYPYMKNCNIYVQPSFSEGFCTTTMEAKILCKPIVTTDAPGMREQITNGENGLIVDDMTPEALFDGIRTLLDDPKLCRKFTDYLEQNSLDNHANAELQKLYDLIEN